MSSRHLVDPELAPTLEAQPPLQLTRETLPQIRAAAAALDAQQVAAAPAVPSVQTDERHVPGPAGGPDVRVLVYRPADRPGPLPALLWMHGGGYVLGSADADAAKLKALVAAVGCLAVSVDYRLAPETPHPGPVEDCYAALAWLHRNAAALGADPGRLAVGGESAGGGLAAALALLARDRGEVPLCFQLLIYPMLDDRTARPAARHPLADVFSWTPEANAFGWAALLGDEPGGATVSPYAAAARAEDLAGLPAACISIGALDLFLDENVEYARRLIRAGVPTELHVYPGAFHGFPIVAAAAVTRAYHRDLVHALRRALLPARHASAGWAPAHEAGRPPGPS